MSASQQPAVLTAANGTALSNAQSTVSVPPQSEKPPCTYDDKTHYEPCCADCFMCNPQATPSKWEQYYADGNLLFSRTSIEVFDRRVNDPDSHSEDMARIKNSLRYKKQLEAGYEHWHGIFYNSIQSLASRHPAGTSEEEPMKIGVSYCEPHAFAKKIWTMDEMAAMYASAKEEWKKSDTCAMIRENVLSAPPTVPVTKIVCFGLGSLCPAVSYDKQRSYFQHAAIETLVSIFREKGQKDGADVPEIIPCIVQDPVYKDLDKKLFADLNLQIVPDPQGFLAIDANTLVFTVAPNVPVRQIVADCCIGAWPAGLLIHTVRSEAEQKKDVGGWSYDENGQIEHFSAHGTDPESSRVREMIEDCVEVPFPEDGMFGRMSFYLRNLPG